MITLREINKENFGECVRLEVEESQKNFVAGNVESLAEAWLHPAIARPFAIYNDDTMVGFAMLDIVEGDKDCGLWRFMIDRKYQNKGYGKAAMSVILDYVRKLGMFSEMRLSFEPENTVAEKLYAGFGFRATGEIDDGEVVMMLEL